MLNNVMKETEIRHMVITKNTRSGKSAPLQGSLPAHINKKRALVIYDKKDTFIAQSHEKGKDIIFNPGDKSCSSIFLGTDTKELKPC